MRAKMRELFWITVMAGVVIPIAASFIRTRRAADARYEAIGVRRKIKGRKFDVIFVDDLLKPDPVNEIEMAWSALPAHPSLESGFPAAIEEFVAESFLVKSEAIEAGLKLAIPLNIGVRVTTSMSGGSFVVDVVPDPSLPVGEIVEVWA